MSPFPSPFLNSIDIHVDQNGAQNKAQQPCHEPTTLCTSVKTRRRRSTPRSGTSRKSRRHPPSTLLEPVKSLLPGIRAARAGLDVETSVVEFLTRERFSIYPITQCYDESEMLSNSRLRPPESPSPPPSSQSGHVSAPSHTAPPWRAACRRQRRP